MQGYIYGASSDTHIIDLKQTADALNEACNFVRKAASDGKNILFVGTKKQASEIVEEEARRCGAFFVNQRWLGGSLTNFETVRSRIERLRNLEAMRETGEFYRKPKKELAVLNRELYKLERSLGGVKNMRRTPDILFVIDQKRELIAVSEAVKLGITVIAIVDTNSNPSDINYVIPGNDDSIRSIKLIAATLSDAVIEGRKGPDGDNKAHDVSPNTPDDIGPFLQSAGVRKRPYPTTGGASLVLSLPELDQD